MNKPFVVLGTYKPKVWKAWKVGEDLTDLTASFGLVPHVDPVHGPIKLVKSWYSDALHAEVRKKTSLKAMSAEGWHYDGDTTPGSKPECCLVLWATANPTEFTFKNGNGKVFQPEPFQVVIAHNLHALHRRPAGSPVDRWVFRQRVAVPTHMELP